MKNISKVVALLTAIALVSANAYAADVKIAVLDMQMVMNGTKVAQEKQADLKKRSEAAQKRFAEMEESFKKRVEDLESKKSILSEDKFLEEQSELRRLGRERQGEVQTVNDELGHEYKRIQKQISDEVDLIVTEMSKAKGYDAVLAKGYLLYSSDSVDITDEVLKSVDAALNKKNKKSVN
tara:strand:- start:187979 stop:188518 length:540 start_codon:yes stop_codon:yes gene_type:complete